MGKRRFNDISCVALISSAMCKCVCLFQGAGASRRERREVRERLAPSLALNCNEITVARGEEQAISTVSPLCSTLADSRIKMPREI